MAKNLSSGNNEINENNDDEKEEGEISLDDVSSCDEEQIYKPKELKNCCPHCKSQKTCAIWCGSLIKYKNNYKKGIKGKENLSNHQQIIRKPVEEISSSLNNLTTDPSQIKSKNVNSGQQQQWNANNDLVPISSGSEGELFEPDESEEMLMKKKKRRVRKRKKNLETSTISKDIVALLVKQSLHGTSHRHSLDKQKYNNHSSVILNKSKWPHLPPFTIDGSDSLKKTTNKSLKVEAGKPVVICSKNKLTNKLAKKKVTFCLSNSLKGNNDNSLVDELTESIMLKDKKKNEESVNVDVNAKVQNKKKIRKVEVVRPKRQESLSSQNKVTRLLKKVRNLEPSFLKNSDKGMSLKDKLINGVVKKESTERLLDVVVKSEAPEDLPTIKVIDLEEEPKKIFIVDNKKKSSESNVELLLPQRSLSPLLTRPVANSPPTSPSTKLPNFCIDDNDEDQKLRMAALHSAVLKKHLTRMQKSGKKKKIFNSTPRMDSPFTSTFFRGHSLLDENSSTLLENNKNDIYCPEDMELDSDFELDKELSLMDAADFSSIPYSPSDDIIDQFVFDDDDEKETQVVNLKNSTPHNRKKTTVNNLSLYSPSKPTETPIDFFKMKKRKKNVNKIFEQSNLLNGSILFDNAARPYSPTDATVYDPDLPGVLSTDKPSNNFNDAINCDLVLPLQPPPLPPLSILEVDKILNMPTEEPMEPPPLPPPTLLNNILEIVEQQPVVNGLFTFVTSVEPIQPKFTTTPINSLTELLSGKNQLQFNDNQYNNNQRLTGTVVNNDTTIVTIEPDNFCETDLDGSPLVPTDESHTLKINADVNRNNKTAESTIPRITFEGFSPKHRGAPSKNSLFKPIKLQVLPKKNVTTLPAAVFSMSIDDDDDDDDDNDKVAENKKEMFINNQTVKKNTNKQSSREEKILPLSESIRRDRKKITMPNFVKQVEKNESTLRSLVTEATGKKKASSTNNIVTNHDRVIIPRDKTAEAKKMETSKNDFEKNDKNDNVEDDVDALRQKVLATLNKSKKSSPSVQCTLKRDAQQAVSNAKKSMLMKYAVTTFNKQINSVNSIKNNNIINNNLVIEPNFLSSNEVKKNSSSMKRLATSSFDEIEQQQPTRKIIKKANVNIPASTKVVNNAKKYQNSINQRRLTQQKLINTTKSIFKINNCPQSSTLLINQQNQNDKEEQRFVINVNEEESDDSESKEEEEQQQKQMEMSVDQFLKNIRQQHKEKTANKSTLKNFETSSLGSQKRVESSKSSTTTLSPVVGPNKEDVIIIKTPTKVNYSCIVEKENLINVVSKKIEPDKPSPIEVVKHLPAPKQEEYRLLKQKLIEMEKTKLQQSKEIIVANKTSSSSSSIISKTISSNNIDSAASSRETSLVNNNKKLTITSPLVAKSLPTLNKTALKVQQQKSTNNNDNNNIVDQENIFANKATSINLIDKTNQKLLKTTAATNVNRSSVQNLSKELEILNRLNSVLNNQKKQISAVAQKVSTLKILTKDQINQKVFQQKKNKTNDLANENKEEENNVNQSMIEKSSENSLEMARNVLTLQKTKSSQRLKKFKETVDDEMQYLFELSFEKQKDLLLKSEEKLINKRHSVLDDIKEMSSSLGEWEIERDLQNNIYTEIQELKERLKKAEKKLELQKEKLNTIQPKVTQYHEKINNGRKECFKLSKMCDNLGQIINGPDYKVPLEGAEVLNNRINEIANLTRRLKNKTHLVKKNTNCHSLTKTKINPHNKNSNNKSFDKNLNKKNNLIDKSNDDKFMENRSVKNQMETTVKNCNEIAETIVNDDKVSSSNNLSLPSNVDSELQLIETIEKNNVNSFESSLIKKKSTFKEESVVKNDTFLVNTKQCEKSDSIVVRSEEEDQQRNSIEKKKLNTLTVLNVDAINSKKSIDLEVERSSNNDKFNNNNVEKEKSIAYTEESCVLKVNDNLKNSIELRSELPEKISSPKKINTEKSLKKIIMSRRTRKKFTKQIIIGQANKSKNLESTNKKTIHPYESILVHLHEPRNKIDGILCPYELSGKCNDEDCQFTHLSASHCSFCVKTRNAVR